MSQDDYMHIVATLDKSIGGIYRHALRPSRSEMRDHKS
jgi:hypothetical protein